ncbi:hypothetical protein GCM10009718_14910 [Isoptericola halotolerans]|uniref:Uncharacterized protein n=1 Tax=Isoptericola halotolerans TaxID=300560 RepID=A0ABX1ZYA4_9MICO|nr:DUF2255 family protein [Isoptericola halotolerans]NOV95587.1 hypothetical protein [Isoptericola halotolerans]
MPRPGLDALAALPVAQLLTNDAGPATPAWVVSVGRELYVRPGPGGEALGLGGGRARVRTADGVHHVTLAEVAPEVHAVLDDAYRAKYGRCGPEKVSALVSDVAAAATFRLGSRRPSLWERTVPLLDRAATWWERVRAPRGARATRVPCPSC